MLGASPGAAQRWTEATEGFGTGTSGANNGTGTGTGGLGGGTGTTFTSSGNVVQIVNLSERKSASTTGYFSGSWQTLTGRHCAGIQIHSYSWTYTGSTPPSNVSAIYHNEAVYIGSGTELGSIPSGSSFGSPPSGSGGPTGVAGVGVSAGNDIVVQTSDTGTIESGRTLTFYILTTVETVYNDGTGTGYTYTWKEYQYDLVKLACQDAGLTTRRTYGNPGTSGELPADPNAPLRNPNYGSWFFSGGLFVGNMPAAGSDASGTARTDLFVQGGSDYFSFDGSTYVPNYDFAVLSVYDMGKPSNSGLTGAIDVGLYVPGSSDPLLTSLTESTVTWSNQWAINPEGVSTGSTDYATHPFTDKNLTDGSTDDYIIFPMSLIAMPGGGSPIQVPNCLTGICLAIVNEASTISAGTECWHYLASREYAGQQSSFPGIDSFPRVWLIQLIYSGAPH